MTPSNTAKAQAENDRNSVVAVAGPTAKLDALRMNDSVLVTQAACRICAVGDELFFYW